VLAEEGRVEELVEEVAGGGEVWQASGAERDEMDLSDLEARSVSNWSSAEVEL